MGLRQYANVQMCKCANVVSFEVLKCMWDVQSIMHLHICTFAHLHICILASRCICTLAKPHLHICTFAYLHIDQAYRPNRRNMRICGSVMK